jgi:pyruvate formate lyase activating enzyme
MQNLEKLSVRFSPVVVRIPFIPGANDRREDQIAMYRFVSGLKTISKIEIMPYHRLGLTKYRGLGRRYDWVDLPSLNKKGLSYLVELGRETGVEVRIGSA